MKFSRFTLPFIIFAPVIGYCGKPNTAPSSHYVPGTDITAQLEADLNAGLSIKLPEGHFYVSHSIFIEGYPGGEIKGAGMDATFIETAPSFQAQPDPSFGGVETATILGLFWVTGDTTIKSMTFLVSGAEPAALHRFNPFTGGDDLDSTNIDFVIDFLGEPADPPSKIVLRNLGVFGEMAGDAEGATLGYNVTSSLSVGGWSPGKPMDVSTKNCIVDRTAFAMAVYATYGGSSEFKDNLLSNCFEGMFLGWGNANGLIVVKENQFINCEFSITNFSSNTIIKNNTISP